MKTVDKARILAPNLFTLGNLLCGYVSTISSLGGKVDLACQLILLGALLDYIDGLVARKLNSQTKFGVEFDSIADFLTFGIAPSAILYSVFSKYGFDQLILVIGFIYSASVAIRLARFNSADTGSLHFRGLPSPAGAITLASLFQITKEIDDRIFLFLTLIPSTLFISFLLVSKIVFLSLKENTRISLKQKFLISVLLGVIYYFGWYAVLFIMAIYVISGPLIYLSRLFKLFPRF